MAYPWCKASSAASARLMGEHAVLRHGPALVFSLHPRMTVCARLKDGNDIILGSKFGQEQIERADISLEGPHRFIKACLQECLPLIPHAIELQVHSDFEHTVGLGSSAAVVAATMGAILQLTKGAVDRQECLLLSQKAIRTVQGDGSGADAAASIFGGVLLFYADGGRVRRIADTLPLHLAYSGMKTPTKEVIAIVKRKEEANPHALHEIFSAMNTTTLEAQHAIEQKNLPLLGSLLNKAHAQMVALGLENEALASLRNSFLHDPHVLGCKISGSGLGDCVVLLGANLSQASAALCLPLRPDIRGLETEWITQ